MDSNPNIAGISREFVRAGHALFTVVGRTTRFTFRVVKAEKRSPQDRDRWFVSYLTGSNNETDYTYIGVLGIGAGSEPDYLRLTKASQLAPDALPVKAFNFTMAVLAGYARLPDGCEVHHEGKCGRCGRTLTVPDSIKTGLGPECAKLAGVA